MKKTTWAAISLLLAAAILLILVLVMFPGKPAGSGNGAELLLDGAALPAAYLPGASEDAPAAGDLRVVISLDGRDVAVLPFGEAHT